MSEIRRYVLVDSDGNEGDAEYGTLQEAVRHGDGTQAVLAQIYVYDDNELAWTPDGSDTWPPNSDEEDDDPNAVRCIECGGVIDPDDFHAGYGMCSSCLHNALRSGWDPGNPDV